MCLLWADKAIPDPQNSSLCDMIIQRSMMSDWLRVGEERGSKCGGERHRFTKIPTENWLSKQGPTFGVERDSQ